MLVTPEENRTQWRIQGALPAPPPRTKIFLISCSFLENLANLYISTPPESWCPLLLEILDPPLGDPSLKMDRQILDARPSAQFSSFFRKIWLDYRLAPLFGLGQSWIRSCSRMPTSHFPTIGKGGGPCMVRSIRTSLNMCGLWETRSGVPMKARGPQITHVICNRPMALWVMVAMDRHA